MTKKEKMRRKREKMVTKKWMTKWKKTKRMRTKKKMGPLYVIKLNTLLC
jgi:hypothetical protein